MLSEQSRWMISLTTSMHCLHYWHVSYYISIISVLVIISNSVVFCYWQFLFVSTKITPFAIQVLTSVDNCFNAE